MNRKIPSVLVLVAVICAGMATAYGVIALGATLTGTELTPELIVMNGTLAAGGAFLACMSLALLYLEHKSFSEELDALLDKAMPLPPVQPPMRAPVPAPMRAPIPRPRPREEPTFKPTIIPSEDNHVNINPPKEARRTGRGSRSRRPPETPVVPAPIKSEPLFPDEPPQQQYPQQYPQQLPPQPQPQPQHPPPAPYPPQYDQTYMQKRPVYDQWGRVVGYEEPVYQQPPQPQPSQQPPEYEYTYPQRGVQKPEILNSEPEDVRFSSKTEQAYIDEQQRRQDAERQRRLIKPGM